MEKQPKYQRAQITKSRLFPHMVGAHVWIENTKPKMRIGRTILTRVMFAEPCLRSADLRTEKGHILIPPEYLELLPQFTDDMPSPIDFETWSRPEWASEKE